MPTGPRRTHLRCSADDSVGTECLFRLEANLDQINAERFEQSFVIMSRAGTPGGKDRSLNGFSVYARLSEQLCSRAIGRGKRE